MKKSPTKNKSRKPKAPKHNTLAVLVQVNGMPHKTLKPLYPPGKSVVVVESVTKAKVIQGYLGDMFEVLPGYGHVRALAGRSGSVRPDEEFSMVWEVPTTAWTNLKSFKVALNGAKNLILASDPDREGEAIAWHIMEMLQQQEAPHKDITVARVVFHEITESSIKSALQTPRDIDANLVHAYLVRRALDYLIGFSISPLLWRKLPACQSAGRVQSAALALTCDREMEIDEFKPQEYWSVKVDFKKNDSDELLSRPSHLTHSGSKKLEQLSISSDGEAWNIEKKITSSCFEVVGSRQSKARKNPPAPYITSILQQDAANKLHFSVSYMMKLAQKLYGVKLSDEEATGLITYMRTDGLHVSVFLSHHFSEVTDFSFTADMETEIGGYISSLTGGSTVAFPSFNNPTSSSGSSSERLTISSISTTSKSNEIIVSPPISHILVSPSLYSCFLLDKR